MKLTLIFASGMAAMTAIYSALSPLCNLSNFFVGFCLGAIVMTITAFIGGCD